ncbi:MAG: prolipoprotein diacylglyceryl transferase [Ignavibacteria bacterium]|jgi:phosphatidylglycerol:prolipoprotein diacylglycerol transferase|nr:prolipoprotein diacylglyceryl transferase [Ignavibacteria bacterium]MCU7502952.1 prolipoprotein diacylglyceryl transferase [Ignavibacteria bacterium]MCU7517065.1 prolipoprotein diacylglyceryl transferase [Ignavibacteria bacterium]
MLPSIVIGNTVINTYSLSLMIAILSGLLIAYKECKRLNLPVYHFPPTAFFGVVSGIIGAKIFEIIFYEWNDFIRSPLSSLLSGGGWMYYGAEIVGILGGVTYLVIRRIPVLSPLDVTAFAFMLAHAFGRVGCFLSGCCYGLETTCFTGVTFPGHHIKVHPTQLYESIPLLLGFTIFWFLRKKFVVPGTIFASYLVFYSILRFSVEFYRYDAYRFGFLSLSPSQYIAAVLFIAGLVAFPIILKSYSAQAKEEMATEEKKEYVI